ncbi:MAG: hypothetical protein IKA17_00150 [Clostridia bacterium]|nr:hypothetical protein [Clostridia bacterium]
MKKKILIMVTALVVLFVIAAYAAQPGTDADPLVTKSYIENVVYPYVNNAAKFRVVNVPAKKSVICYAGTEVVVRSGLCTVIADKNGGLSDVTAGADIQNAEIVPLNHMVVVPRSDGRGIWAAMDSIVMIKGDYNIR